MFVVILTSHEVNERWVHGPFTSRAEAQIWMDEDANHVKQAASECDKVIDFDHDGCGADKIVARDSSGVVCEWEVHKVLITGGVIRDY